jgi:hypothetical protein
VPIGDAGPVSVRRRSDSARRIGERAVWWGAERVDTPLYRWDDVPVERWLDGPLLLIGAAGTHAIGPGWRVQLDELGNALWESV